MDVFVLRSRALSVLMFIGVAGAALSLAGCGDDDSEETSATAASSPANQAPSISGTPTTTVMQGNSYSFTPNASDADGDTLTYSVSNLPSWATFDSSTGKISGTPSAADVRSYSSITISVSDGTATASLTAFAINVVATATGSVTLIWTPPTQNTDGTALTDLAGYRVHWGTSQSSFTNSATVNNPGLSSYVIDQLTPTTWYFTVTAINSVGLESSYSNVAIKQVL